jgi:hypothetical protein
MLKFMRKEKQHQLRPAEAFWDSTAAHHQIITKHTFGFAALELGLPFFLPTPRAVPS